MNNDDKPLGGLGLAIYEHQEAWRAFWLHLLDSSPYLMRLVRWMGFLV